MKKLILVFLIGVSGLVFFCCQEDSALTSAAYQNEQSVNSLELAKKPAANLIGTMDLYFTFGQWPAQPVWEGTIYFEEFGTFGMRFYHLSPFKEYSQASPFEERFEIYTVVGEDTTVVLAGPDEGVTTLANKPPEDPTKYRMNGEIDLALEPFDEWLGRHVHMSGIITWQTLQTPEGPVVAPDTAPGIFRIN